MANRKWSDVQSSATNVKLYNGHFVTNGSSNPTVASGTGWRVDRTGTGAYKVSCSGVGADPGRLSQLQTVTTAGMMTSGTATDLSTRITAMDHNNSTVTITTYSGTSAWDFPSGQVVVNFILIGRNSPYGT